MNDINRMWYNNIAQFFNKDNLLIFFPRSNYSVVDNLNALMKLSLYAGILLALYANKSQYLFIPIVMAMLTYFVSETQLKRVEYPLPEKFVKQTIDKRNMTPEEQMYYHRQLQSDVCRVPTRDNPYMNPNLTEDLEKTGSIPACYPTDHIKKETRENDYSKLYRDVSDVFEKENNQRQFYTLPNTTVPNNQKEFAEWCYGNKPSCRDPNETAACVRYEDIRQQPRFIP